MIPSQERPYIVTRRPAGYVKTGMWPSGFTSARFFEYIIVARPRQVLSVLETRCAVVVCGISDPSSRSSR